MGSAWQQLEQMLTCPICLDKFKAPRMLPCQHSFCGDECLEGLVDYARNQIKCPECRAEHRVPYQGVQTLPVNVTLTRFLELHSRITGDDCEPAPTFLAKCQTCGEKCSDVCKCHHCDKKLCSDCRKSHADLLRRELIRLAAQIKRLLFKCQDFEQMCIEARLKLDANKDSVKREINNQCDSLIAAINSKRAQMIESADSYATKELKTLDKLLEATKDETRIMASNVRLVESRFTSSGKNAKASDTLTNIDHADLSDNSQSNDKTDPNTSSSSPKSSQWTELELFELKDIYSKSMEFMRLFEPELGDCGRKMRLLVAPDYELTKRRLIGELGELKLAEGCGQLMATALSYCNARGQLAVELAREAGQQLGDAQIGASQMGGGVTLELPSQNALMRSQSDHRLASQLQQMRNQAAGGKQGGAQGSAKGTGLDYDSNDPVTNALRSRYAPRGSNPNNAYNSAGSSYASDLLSRDWPRPSDHHRHDNDNDSALPFSSTIQYRSAFMRRKERRDHDTNSDWDQDDLASEVSGTTSRHLGVVRFSEQLQNPSAIGAPDTENRQPLFDTRDLERGPLSATPKLDDSPYLLEREHEMGARSKVDRAKSDEQQRHDRELIESTRQVGSQYGAAAAKKPAAITRQPSDDEIERQKRANKHRDQQQQQATPANESGGRATALSTIAGSPEPQPRFRERQQSQDRPATPTRAREEQPTATPTSTGGGGVSQLSRRELYNQAMSEKSKRQLASAVQEASRIARRASATLSQSREDDDDNGTVESAAPVRVASPDATPTPTSQSGASGGRPRRLVRGGSRQSSVTSGDPGDTGTVQRRGARRLARAGSSSAGSGTQTPTTVTTPSSASLNKQVDESKNSPLGSGSQSAASGLSRPETPPRSAAQRASATTDQDQDQADEQDANVYEFRRPMGAARTPTTTTAPNSKSSSRYHQQDSDDDDDATTTSKSTPSRIHRSSSGASNHRRRVSSSSTDDDDDDDDATNDRLLAGADADIDDDDNLYDDATSDLPSSSAISANHRNRKSREFLPSAVNRLLDRSAQIRRDSREQRQDSVGSSASSASVSSQPRPSGGAYSRPSAASRYSSYASGRAKSNSRSQQEADDDDVYVPEPSSSYSYSRKLSGGSGGAGGGSSSSTTNYGSSALSTSTVRPSAYIGASSGASGTTSGSSWRTDSNSRDTPSSSTNAGGFQSRFLARSRTHSSLATGGDSSATPSSSAALTTSSRDRFLASASTASSVGTIQDTPIGGHSSYSRPSATSGSSSGNSQATSTTADNDLDIDDDDLDPNDNNDGGDLAGSEHYGTLRFDATIGCRGPQPGQLMWPRGICLDEESGCLVVADSSNHRVQVFGSSLGDFRWLAGGHGKLDGQFDCLTGVAYNPVGKFYVISDRYNNRLQFLSSLDGSHLHSVGAQKSRQGKLKSATSKSSQLERLDCPWGVACDDATGNVYVCDKNNCRVKVYGLQGNFVSSFGRAQLKSPHYIDVRDNLVVVSDTNMHKLDLYDLEGRHSASLGVDQGLGFPRGVAIDPTQGQLLVVGDSNNNRLQAIDLRANSVAWSFGCWGPNEGQFKGIEGVAIGSDGRIFVCDRENHRVQAFERHLTQYKDKHKD